MEPTNNLPITWLRTLSEFTNELELPSVGQVVRSTNDNRLYVKDSIVSAVSTLSQRLQGRQLYGELGYKPEQSTAANPDQQIYKRHAAIVFENSRHSISNIKVVETEIGMCVEGCVHFGRNFIEEFSLDNVKFGMRSFTRDTTIPNGEPIKHVNQIVCWDIIDTSPAKLNELITKHPINGEWLDGFLTTLFPNRVSDHDFEFNPVTKCEVAIGFGLSNIQALTRLKLANNIEIIDAFHRYLLESENDKLAAGFLSTNLLGLNTLASINDPLVVVKTIVETIANVVQELMINTGIDIAKSAHPEDQTLTIKLGCGPLLHRYLTAWINHPEGHAEIVTMYQSNHTVELVNIKFEIAYTNSVCFQDKLVVIPTLASEKDTTFIELGGEPLTRKVTSDGVETYASAIRYNVRPKTVGLITHDLF